MKKLLIFLLCFTVLAVGITYGCIQYTLGAPAAQKLPAETGIDLNGFYDENDLLVARVEETIKKEEGEVFSAYPQIDGLKNDEVQTLVNDTICAEAERLKGAEGGQTLSFLSWQIYGNFANTLSVGLFAGYDGAHYEQVYLNFNLNDGSLLRLEDLFRTDADLREVVRTGFYEALTRANLGNDWEEVQSPDENELYKTVKGYLEAEDKKFAFTPSEIYLYWGDYAASVPMKNYAEDIVIYSKYLTEERLFVSDGVGYDGIFTCAAIPGGFDERKFGFGTENFWYDVAVMEKYVGDSLPADTQEQFLSFYDDVYAQLLVEVDTVHALAKANSDRAYILIACPFVNLYTGFTESGNGWSGLQASCAAVVNDNYRLYEMPIDLFHSKYLPALKEEYRGNNYYLFYGGIDKYLDGDEVQLTKRDQERLYNYETREPLTLEAVFAEGYDYASTIRAQAKYDLTGDYGFTPEDAELQMEGAWFTLAGSGVQVNIPAWGDSQHLRMPLSDFPNSALAIFD